MNGKYTALTDLIVNYLETANESNYMCNVLYGIICYDFLLFHQEAE
jgi:hypothetical protein